MMPRNQQSNHEMALLHPYPWNINGVRTLQTDVQQGFQILPEASSAHYLCCSRAWGGSWDLEQLSSLASLLHGASAQRSSLVCWKQRGFHLQS